MAVVWPPPSRHRADVTRLGLGARCWAVAGLGWAGLEGGLGWAGLGWRVGRVRQRLCG